MQQLIIGSIAELRIRQSVVNDVIRSTGARVVYLAINQHKHLICTCSGHHLNLRWLCVFLVPTSACSYYYAHMTCHAWCHRPLQLALAVVFRGCLRQPLYCFHFTILLYGFMLQKQIFNIQYSSAPCAVHTRTCCSMQHQTYNKTLGYCQSDM